MLNFFLMELHLPKTEFLCSVYDEPLYSKLYSPSCPIIFSIRTEAAAAAKSLQLCQTLCDPTDDSPPRSSIPGILQARILEWVAISFSNACMHACMHTKSLQSCPTLCDPMDSPPSSLSRGFSRQEYWSGLPFPSPLELRSIKQKQD